MNEGPIVLRGSDPSTISLVISWLNQNSSTTQEAEGDFQNNYNGNTLQQQRPQVSLGGAAASVSAPHPIFWRTRQVQQYLSSREVLDRYQEVLRLRRNSQEEQQPETMIEASGNNAEDNTSWYLDSRSVSVKEGSQTDSEVYHRSDSNTTTTSSAGSSDSQEQKVPLTAQDPESTDKPIAGPLENPLLRAFILDLDDAEMNPMLHLVTNMMTPMYFNDQEAEIVRHFMLHKIQNTINNIQLRMDMVNLGAFPFLQPEEIEIPEEEFDETEEDSETETLLDEQETNDSNDATSDISDDENDEASASLAFSEDSNTLVTETAVPKATREESVTEVDPVEELQVEPVGDEGVTEISMQLVKQMMELKSNKKRRALVKKSRKLVSEKEQAVLEYFEYSLRSKETSWWKCF
ncbi:Hypothetical predicted protein [Cloeon dipterum]|uniref:Uncharacterized protein n=1 Tax=Cloeon dipterum TaxID=197152 RepID=A0A8S1CWB4_9INSE|nr:Hypothetical predicted protein [Cloeon dipterum]